MLDSGFENRDYHLSPRELISQRLAFMRESIQEAKVKLEHYRLPSIEAQQQESDWNMKSGYMEMEMRRDKNFIPTESQMNELQTMTEELVKILKQETPHNVEDPSQDAPAVN